MVIVFFFLERWHKDDRYRKSLSDIGWTEEQINNMTQLHWKIIPTWLELQKAERSPNEKSWEISLNREGMQGPMNQRPNSIDAKHKCKRLCDEYVERTGEGNEPIPPAQQMRQRREQHS